jgi:hypothetical protein
MNKLMTEILSINVIHYPSNFHNFQARGILYLPTELYYATLNSNAHVLYQHSTANHEELSQFNHTRKHPNRLTSLYDRPFNLVVPTCSV